MGIVTYSDYSLVSDLPASNCGGPNTTCGAANPNDVLTLWATGLGPVSAPDSSGPQSGNMPNIPLSLWLGGVQATVTYQGRSGCCIGEDEIVFTVPANAPTGCAVPLLIQIGNQLSNSVVIPVERQPYVYSHATQSGRQCLSATDHQQQCVGFRRTRAPARRHMRHAPCQPAYQDQAEADFAPIAIPAADQPFIISYLDVPPFGSQKRNREKCRMEYNPISNVTNLS